MISLRILFYNAKRFGFRTVYRKMAQQPIVTTQEGQVRGKTAIDCRVGKYFSFLGIPYAKPPLGELRFKAPQPPEPWTGIKEATKHGNQCYSRHMIYHNIEGSEDCLFLNVYTPELPSGNSALKPVMVWVHTGTFIAGSGNMDVYGPDFLVPEDVVVVTINYRLGLLGFLNMQDPSLGVPGNAALKDQVAALKWVQRNISSFNGDPNNVTIFGGSAGGVLVHCLMLSSMAKGLFHKVIAQSGSALAFWSKGLRSASLIKNALKLNTTDEKAILRILQEMPLKDLFKTQEKIPGDLDASKIRFVGPVIETPSNETPFFLEEPIDIITSGKFNRVPLLIGYTSREGMVCEIISKFKYGEARVLEDFESAVPHMLQIPRGSDMSKRVAHKIKQFYYGEEKPSLENIDQFYLLHTDNWFFRSIHATVKLHTAVSPTPIYFYRISIESTLNLYKKLHQIRNPGVCHNDDLGYIFKNMMTPKIRPGTIEDEAVRRITKLWTTFARNGDPNPVEKDPLINVTWKPVEQNQHHFLDIGENLTMGVNPEARRMAFWDEIYSLSSVGANY